uniref:Family with sequence similarity 177 member A1 n=1 Tax=Sphaeramia orbicularis TaxID=375764 RepID=A0A672ZBZ4_9TELE
MADISLYLTNVNVSIGQNMDVEKVRKHSCVTLCPLTVCIFSSPCCDLFTGCVYVCVCVCSKMTWGPYFWFHMWRAATSTISACDYLGERMASLFGITSAKYQYAIDEYYRMKKEREEEKEENRLSEEAERSFDRAEEGEDEAITMTERSGEMPAAAARPDATYQIENENHTPANTIRVPAIITAT